MTKKKTKSTNKGLEHQILCVFSKNPFNSFNFKQLSARLGIKDKASRELIKSLINKLVKEDVLVERGRGKYIINRQNIPGEYVPKSMITGIVDMKQTGKAYILPDNGGEDVFINAGNTNHALNGDHVKVLLFPRRKSRKQEGQIVEVLKRKTIRFVGTIQVSKHFAFLIPDEESMPTDIFISKERLNGAEDGDKVLGEIIEWPERAKNPFGTIIEVLGKPGDNNVEMTSILTNFDLNIGFSDGLLKEADNIPKTISKEEIKKRRDFRKVFTLTIDPFDAKDFDDAISIKKLSDTSWEIGVHIADVSHYVKENSGLDKEAFERANSVYLVDRVIPMLPEVLSNQLCSLRPNEDKLCFSAVFEVDNKMKILKHWFGKTIINSDKRYNYEEVQEIIEGKNKDAFSKDILKLHQLAQILRKARFTKGSIDFHSQEVRFVLDKEGNPIKTYVKIPQDSNHLVEEFMLLANKKVAERIGIKGKEDKKEKSFVYRVHDEPTYEKLNAFSEFISKFGYSINYKDKSSMANSFNKLFQSISGKAEENLIETIALRTMAKAIYSTDNHGHYGLSFSHYTHFTSPIRRYADLMVHRLLEHYLNGGKSANKEDLEEQCKHISEQERIAIDAERMSVKYMQAKFLLDKVGQNFKGVISGVSKWGIFVELEDNKCEGMVSLKTMKDDYYFLDEDNYQVIGHNSHKKYTLGDKVKIRVIEVDLSKRQMNFQLLS
jgi:ribonuclease R